MNLQNMHNPEIQKKLHSLSSRFNGALQFFKTIRFSHLPWYLLIGPKQAGKTTLLAKSQISFILQKQFKNHDLENNLPSENVDWWATRDLVFVDVPSDYFANSPVLWDALLRLIKKKRSANGIDGLIITLPLSYLSKEAGLEKYPEFLADLSSRMQDIEKLKIKPPPCHLVITQCDLIPGFVEFFDELDSDGMAQSWGITLPDAENISSIFLKQFDVLIRNLNKRLITRLHHERNPKARPYIKDFPLQIEKMKEIFVHFLDHFAMNCPRFPIKSVHLTSLHQPRKDDLATVENEIKRYEPCTSKPYFVRQLLLNTLLPDRTIKKSSLWSSWKNPLVYATSIGLITLAAVLLGTDFLKGMKKTHATQIILTEFQTSEAKMQDPNEHLVKTLLFLSSLEKNKTNPAHDASSFYSNKSREQANDVYYKAFQTILLPEIKNYFEKFLISDGGNVKSLELTYAALKSYLMLSEPKYFQPEFIANTILQISPSITNKDLLKNQLSLLLKMAWKPLALNSEMLTSIRKKFSSLPSKELAYLILKNINQNNVGMKINLGTEASPIPIFISNSVVNNIPYMFTAKAFSVILSQEITQSAEQASRGNWVIGPLPVKENNALTNTALIEQLQAMYVNNYIDVWESLLANIHLAKPADLIKTHLMIYQIISTNSPLLQLLKTLHDNTFFEPVISASPKIQSLDLLIANKNQNENLLYQIFTRLQSVQENLASVVTNPHQKKAAFDIVSARKHNPTIDAITQLRLVAEKSPPPIKNWLIRLADYAWQFLLSDATHYMDTSLLTPISPQLNTVLREKSLTKEHDQTAI